MSTHFYKPADGHGLPHDPFNAIVGPRPIGWVSTLNEQGQRNLAPYSFFTAFNYTPPIVGFTSIGEKDSLRNARATGEFVWNLVTTDLAQAMNETCAVVPLGVSEFELGGVTPTPSNVVKPPRVLESPVNFECKVTQITQLTTLEGDAIETWLVLGQVVGVHIDHKLLVNGVYDTAGAGHVLRGGGAGDYFSLTPETKFLMPRPASAAAQQRQATR
jgi:flavin reductase (DIM6/NTAB) family NADH-FMN oxidoreductase RutF